MRLGPATVVTTSSTPLAAWAAVVAVSEVLLTTVTLVAAVPPRLIVAPAAKPVPVRVTAVPPLLVPELGEIALTVGAGTGEGWTSVATAVRASEVVIATAIAPEAGPAAV